MTKVDHRCIGVLSLAPSKGELSCLGVECDSGGRNIRYAFSVLSVNDAFILLAE